MVKFISGAVNYKGDPMEILQKHFEEENAIWNRFNFTSYRK
jgi:alcohol dehydrogenase YqhD (iron-dependent ADH family)